VRAQPGLTAPAAQLLDALEGRPGRAFIAWHSAANFYYLVSPLRGKGDARAFLADLTRFVDVAPATTAGLRLAAGLPMKDFEAAMQVAAALACGAGVIATRNGRDYARAGARRYTEGVARRSDRLARRGLHQPQRGRNSPSRGKMAGTSLRR
jgi:hypothetical protein